MSIHLTLVIICTSGCFHFAGWHDFSVFLGPLKVLDDHAGRQIDHNRHIDLACFN